MFILFLWNVQNKLLGMYKSLGCGWSCQVLVKANNELFYCPPNVVCPPYEFTVTEHKLTAVHDTNC